MGTRSLPWVDNGAPALNAANLNDMETDIAAGLWGSAASVVIKTANYTLTTSDKVVIFNGSNLTATLPDPTTVGKRVFMVKNIHSSNLTVNSAGTSKTIDGVASISVPSYLVLTFVSDGTSWYILAGGEFIPTANYRPVISTSVSDTNNPALLLDTGGAVGRVPLRLQNAQTSSNPSLDIGFFLAGSFYRRFAINANGNISNINGSNFLIGVASNNPQDQIAAEFGIITDTAAGLTYLQRTTGNAYPRWNLQPMGYFGQPQTKTANYTVDFRDTLLIGNGSSLTFTLPDPTSSGISGRKFEFKNIHSTALTLVSAGTAKTIDGSTTKTLAQWEMVTVVSDGTRWLTVSAREAQTTLVTNGYTQIVDEPGTSFAGWTAVSGTWASDGATINQASTSATLCRARLDTKLPQGSMLVVDLEMQMVSGTGTDQHMGLLLGWSGSGSGAASFRLQYNGTSTYKAEMEQDGVSGRYSAAATWALGDWQKVRVIWSGTSASFYLNGVLLASTTNLTNNTEISYLGLKANAASVKFRNIKVYTPVLPALP